MSQSRMRVAALAGGVVGVDGRGGEPGDGVDQGVLGGDGESWACTHGQRGVDDDVRLGAQRWPIQRIRT